MSPGVRSTLKLLSGVSLEAGNTPVTGRAGQRQRLALLALIASTPSGASRDRIVALLWPDAEPARARHLLSHSLYLLHQALGEDALQATADAVRLNPELVSCDVRAFEEALRAGQHERAASLYTGPFLDGFFLADSPGFERWADAERDRLARACAVALEALASERETAGDWAAAIQWWRRLAAHDPYSSRTAVRLMRALAAGGDIAGALRHAQAHEALLRAELRLGPPEELVREGDRLRREYGAEDIAVTVAPAHGGAHPQDAHVHRAGIRPRWALVAPGLVVAGLVVGTWLLARLREVTVPQGPVVAVLPFQSLSSDPEQAYFADGLTDVLITELARLPGLAVVSRSSVEGYRAGGRPLPAIATELHAAFVVEGTVARDERRARITVQLVNGAKDLHLWAQSYERDLADLLAVQAEVARAVAREIGVALVPIEPNAAPRRVASVPAYEAYLKGLHYSRTAGLRQGMEWLEQAVTLDPTLAPAHAEVARNLYFQAFFGLVEPGDGYPRMRAAAERAIALDPSLSDPHGTLALVLMHWEHDWPEAERHFRDALELDPNNAQVRHDYSHLLLARRRLDEAAGESRRAVAIDPVNPGLEACLGWHYISGRDYQGAVAQSLRAVQSSPDNFWAHQTLGWGYEQVGRFTEAIASLRKAAELSGGLPFVQASLGHSLAMAGNRAAALELVARLSREREQRYVSPYDLAAVYAGLGDPDRAIELLLEAYAERSSQLIHLGWDPRFDPLRRDPRFLRLIRDLGLVAWVGGS